MPKKFSASSQPQKKKKKKSNFFKLVYSLYAYLSFSFTGFNFSSYPFKDIMIDLAFYGPEYHRELGPSSLHRGTSDQGAARLLPTQFEDESAVCLGVTR
jgi:hypothetical protein